MAPKKNAKGKNPKAEQQPAKKPGATNGDLAEETSEQEIALIREELNKERKERNLFQVERDQIRKFWEVSKGQLEEKKAELISKDIELEEANKQHRIEIQMYKEKVAYLLYDHQSKITQLKAEGAVTAQLIEKEQAENEMLKDMQNLKAQMRDQELSCENTIKHFQEKHDEQVTRMRHDFEQKLQELRTVYEKKIETLHEEHDLKCRQEILEIEQRKNMHVSNIITNHEKALSDMKTYISDTVRKKDAVINTLTKQLEERKKREDRVEKELSEVLQQNKLLHKNLQKITDESAGLQKNLVNYNTDKALLMSLKGRIKEMEKENLNMRLLNEVLEQRFSKVQKERDDLYENFVKAIHEVQQTCGYKNMLLERKLSALTDTQGVQKPSSLTSK